jgi:hypothetical protein
VNKSEVPSGKGARLAYAAAGIAALSLLAAACGGGGGTKSASAPTTTTTTVAAAGAGTGARPAAAASFAPAATGTIASITGNTLEVQDLASVQQTTVNVTAKTAITATVYVGLSDITPGTCISATGTKGANGSVDATSVIIERLTTGSCTVLGGSTRAGTFPRGGFGGGGGFAVGGGSGSTGTRPSGSTSRTPFTVPANEASAFGKVTSVSASTITALGVVFSFAGRTTTAPAKTSGTVPPSSPPAASATPKTVTVTVHVTASTKYSKTEKAVIADLKVGECASAFGSTNDIGAVTATRLTVTPAPASGCTTALARGGFFGGRGGFGRGGAGGAGGGFGGTGGGFSSGGAS